MFTAWPGRDVEELAVFSQRDTVPDPARDDECLARTELHRAFPPVVLDDNIDSARDQVQELVAIGMHLAVVGCIPRHVRRSNDDPVDSAGRP